MLSPEQRLIALEQQFPELQSILSHFEPPMLIAMLDSAGSPDAFRQKLEEILQETVGENVEEFIEHINQKEEQQTEEAVKAIHEHTQKALAAIAKDGAEALAALMVGQALDQTTGTAAVLEKREDTRSPAFKQYEEDMQNFVAKFSKPEEERTAAEKTEMKGILAHVNTEMDKTASEIVTTVEDTVNIKNMREFRALNPEVLEALRTATAERAAEIALSKGPKEPDLQNATESADAAAIKKEATKNIAKTEKFREIGSVKVEQGAAIAVIKIRGFGKAVKKHVQNKKDAAATKTLDPAPMPAPAPSPKQIQNELINAAVQAAKDKGIDLSPAQLSGKTSEAIGNITAGLKSGAINADNAHTAIPGAAPTTAATVKAEDAKLETIRHDEQKVERSDEIKASPPQPGAAGLETPRAAGPETPGAAAATLLGKTLGTATPDGPSPGLPIPAGPVASAMADSEKKRQEAAAAAAAAKKAAQQQDSAGPVAAG